MIFLEEEIERKRRFRDNISLTTERIHDILKDKIEGNFEVKKIKKNWNGGGASLYHVEGEKIDAFLKVKSKDMMVESKLEEEENFINESALFHEYSMLTQAKKNGVRVPDVYFYDCDREYDYLLVEYINNSLLEILDCSTIDEIIMLWDDLESNVRKLFENGMVHTDIHEHNIRYMDGKIVLIDLEECRYFRQEKKFEKSLDYVGYNEKSNVGLYQEHMNEEYSTPFTCLERMKEVFKKYMVRRVIKFAPKCNYDSTNGICTTLDHGESTEIYQEINNQYIAIAGQRSFDDRIYYIQGVCNEFLGEEKFNFIDVGSNNGLFCRKMALYYKTQCSKCYGLEGTHNFNVLARGIAFLENAKNTEYKDFLCGDDDLKQLHIQGKSIITMCSVWHHIVNKDVFLQQIKKIEVSAVFLELATQDDLYPAGNWRKELRRIKEILGFRGEYFLTKSRDYDRPIVVITPNEISYDDNEKIEKSILKRMTEVAEQREFDAENLNSIYNQYLHRDKTNGKKYIVCYGAGNYGKRAMHFIGAKNIVFYIDNNKKETGYSSHRILSQRDALKIIDNDTTIIVTIDGEVGETIKRSLINLGVKNVRTLNEVLTGGYIKKIGD